LLAPFASENSRLIADVFWKEGAVARLILIENSLIRFIIVIIIRNAQINRIRWSLKIRIIIIAPETLTTRKRARGRR
jgi:hypothetical protein